MIRKRLSRKQCFIWAMINLLTSLFFITLLYSNNAPLWGAIPNAIIAICYIVFGIIDKTKGDEQ